MLVVLLGAPGVGKGTQAVALTERLGLAHVSSGDLLRSHRQRKTDLGAQAQAYMDRGDLVPDDLVIRMVLDRLEQETAGPGVILDGFPRTAPQAAALDDALGARGVDRVVYLTAPEEELVSRLSGRYSCLNCQRPYTAREADAPCPACGGALGQREDDRPEAVRNRLRVYAEQTSPLVAYYCEQGKLTEIDGVQKVVAVTGDLLAALEV